MSTGTLAKLSHHNKRLIRYCLEKAYPDGIISVERLIDDNLISGTQVAELAVCRTNGNIEMCPVGIGRDLTDDSDVKTVTVQQENYKSKIPGKILFRHRSQVKDIVNKIGKLRVISYNPFFDNWKFFIIPNEAFCNLKKLTLTFDKTTGEPIGMYKQFEVQSWEELCKL